MKIVFLILVSEDQLSDSFETGRRSKLPVPKPDTGDISLWNLLYKNIGKDLSKISMPITLNEPLSMLQVGGFLTCMFLIFPSLPDSCKHLYLIIISGTIKGVGIIFHCLVNY